MTTITLYEITRRKKQTMVYFIPLGWKKKKKVHAVAMKLC